jgi:hypothetical protein
MTIVLKNIKKSNICYDNNPIHYVKDYYNYIVNLIEKVLLIEDININIIIGNYSYIFKNNNKILHINLNYEHTLVKKGNRDSENVPIGKILINNSNSEYYRVRIYDFTNLNKADFIIEYSNPNIINIKESTLFDSFYQKIIYIAPLLFDNLTINNNNIKNINCLTTFINIYEPRRLSLLNNISNNNICHLNVNNCFDYNDLQNLYKNTKILINIHQTDHHHTCEELRILPALQCGVIVICEESPLKEQIPYNQYILWCDYDNLIEKIKYVEENYDEIYKQIFINSNIKKDLDLLQENNIQNLYNFIIKN